jgi:hypothetical protein
MRKWLFVVALVAAVAMCASAPSAALAKAPTIKTAIRGVHAEYVIPRLHVVGEGVSIKGRLVSVKTVYRRHRKVNVDSSLNGTVVLYRLNDDTGQLVKVAETRTDRGVFTFNVPQYGSYQISYWGNRDYKKCRTRPTVFEDALGLANFGGWRAQFTPSGDIFVTVTADFSAPAGVLTSETPGAAILVAGNPGVATQATLLSSGLYSLALQQVPKNGTYRFGFTVPSERRYENLAIICAFAAGDYYVPVTADTQFVPDDLLP